MRELPTIEFVTESGARRKVEYERNGDAPWQAHRTEFEAEETVDGETEWRFVGGEPLRELTLNGEPATARTVASAFEGP